MYDCPGNIALHKYFKLDCQSFIMIYLSQYKSVQYSIIQNNAIQYSTVGCYADESKYSMDCKSGQDSSLVGHSKVSTQNVKKESRNNSTA